MKDTEKTKKQKAITLGKEWMRRSKDPVHDAIHAQAVEDKAMEIYDELEGENYPGIEAVTEDLVIIAAWWHDCYKALGGKFSLYRNFQEGPESVKIIEKQLNDMLSKREMIMVCNAVENHAGSAVVMYGFFNKEQSPLHKILLEADGYEITNPDRFRRLYESKQKLSVLQKAWLLVDLLQPLSYPIYMQTEAVRYKFWARIKSFWKSMLVTDKWVWKLIFHR